MAQYGEIIGELDDCNLSELYNAFSVYFNNPYMTKIKNVYNYSMYMSKTYCLLNKYCRYIIVFVNKNTDSLGSQKMLNQLEWNSLQTRTLADKHNLPPHNYKPTRNTILNTPIQRIKLTEKSSEYSCEKFPLKITLLHTKEKPTYSEKGNVVSALETYETIITLDF